MGKEERRKRTGAPPKIKFEVEVQVRKSIFLRGGSLNDDSRFRVVIFCGKM
jgi:hypothetical protein